MRAFVLASLGVALLTAPGVASAATYQVGPDKPYKSLEELAYDLRPGDVVEVDGDATYSGDIHIRPDSSGTADQPVTIRGIRVNGKRPVISGGVEWGIVLHGSHTVFEGFEVTGASNFCIVHKADQVTIRDVLVHDCPDQGILGTDSESGSLTIEFTEVYGCGEGLYSHQLYIATDETMYPGSVFRLQHSYIHDGNGGNNVKTRAERNEIYCNWIEGPVYHVLDLIDPDGQEPSLAREDSDVVGNVLIQNGDYYIARIGGDKGIGTAGRVRFAYNTMLTSPSAGSFFYMQDELESVAFFDNVFLAPNGGSPEVFRDTDAFWTQGATTVTGSNNFLGSGVVDSSFLSGSVSGDPMLASLAAFDLVPQAGSPVVDLGVEGIGPAGFEVPNAWATPTCVPPPRIKNEALAALARPSDGPPDLGAFELGTTFEPGTGGTGPGAGGAGAGGEGADGDGDGDGLGDGDGESGGCDCHSARSSRPNSWIGLSLLALTWALRKRKR